MKCRMNCAGFSGSLAVQLKKVVSNCLRVLSPEKFTTLCVNKFSRRHPQTEIHFNVICTTDTEMRRMNRQFRGKNKTTDVLTFVYPDLVEIYISLPVARRQARERRVTLAQECQRLLVHGMCHALGFDHHTRDKFMEMRRREFEVLVQCATV